MRITYFYLMKNNPDHVRPVAPDHAAHWHDLDPPAYLGGPMADRSGGLNTFEARSVEEAEQLVAGDPFIRAELLEDSWLKEWTPITGKPTGRDLQTSVARPPGR
jgi:uncharacterized protein YciI